MENNLETKNSTLKKITISFLIILLMSGSFLSGVYLTNKNDKEVIFTDSSFAGKVLNLNSKAKNLDADVDFNLFWDVWELIKKDYVMKDKLKEKEMFYGAIKGLVASTNDPYTIFMDPKEAKSFDDDLAGTFEGIGAEIGIKKGGLVIIAPIPDSPAQKSGLMAGDRILSINGESTVNMTVDQAVSKIRGPKDTEVKLSVLKKGQEKSAEIKIIRGLITVNSVKTEMRKDNLFVITVSNFNNDTEELFNKAVEEVIQKNPKGIIVDLRNNPGGYLDTAITVASKWIEKGVIVSEKFGDEKKNDYYNKGLSKLKDFPTVVLINQGSASASEIVAGALQDYGKAKIIGMQSFGKGSVQIIENLKDGSSLKITIAQWMTPKGNNINEKGITPDKIVDLTQEDYENNKDPQMNAAVEALGGGKK
ncbi:MAG: Carboxyl-terminal protease [Parcubacteria group bacterium GW2011_GWE2_39_37]|uniref:Carboxyl-terminal protease n=1 Tax=Candidatus Falkowbacteria bacterium GW2011_GWF2_39_8 TaxID=1618642 RepID=A0A0G0SDA3_9BACT|nr:MAG: Carboxyl-terminal protease [Parcubacteria group bacterium GW2011_GWE2_39_37]KKR32680.1 MAG: Carboxyl-terminal protease [Candidatus Falkowbacteria bacterium GW2011_GWF2_39_8]